MHAVPRRAAALSTVLAAAVAASIASVAQTTPPQTTPPQTAPPLSAPPPSAAPQSDIPNLLGTWSGQNHTISDKKGLLTRERTVHITEQTDRRFRGHFVYAEGRKDFFGVIFPDNTSFSWVASDSKGYNHGRILGPDRISACYVESGAEATAGCADLARVKN